MKDKRGKKDNKKQDFETHQVAYVDFTVEAAGKTWNFQRPTLVDHPDGKTIVDVKCHRGLCPWDELRAEQKKTISRVKSFVNN